jgi:hypothetical protein
LFEKQYIKKNVSGNTTAGVSLVGNINGKILILSACLRNVIKQLNIMGLLKTLNICGENSFFVWRSPAGAVQGTA